MMKKQYVIILLFIIFYSGLYAQSVGINNTGATPDNSAILDVQSTSKGILVPRMTTIQRNTITEPAQGLLVYDAELQEFWYYDAGWKKIGSTDELNDIDNDTKVIVEQTSDDDRVRVIVEGEESVVFQKNPNGIARINVLTKGHNTLIGQLAGDKLDNTVSYEAIQNVFIGFLAGGKTTTGFNNTFIGSNAGLEHTEGSYNTFIGKGAGNQITGGGGSNTLIGGLAGDNLNAGFNNTFLGYQAGDERTSSQGNTLLGFEAGKTATGSGYNVMIGHRAGKGSTKSNSLYIDNSDTLDPLIYGEFDNNLLRVNGTLNINQEYTLPSVDGIAEQTLITDGNGNVGWGNVSPSNKIEDIDKDTKITVEQNADEDKIRIFLANDELLLFEKNANGDIMIQPTGDYGNTFLGESAGIQNNGTQFGEGLNNTFIGHNAGKDNADGDSNTYLGAFAGEKNEGGGDNTIIGFKAGQNNFGWGNVLLGHEAGSTSTFSNKLYIDNSKTTTPLVYGEFDNDILRINGELQVGTAYSFPLSDGVAGQFMTTDGVGNLSWSTDQVADADSDPTNELQSLSYSANQLKISGGNSIPLKESPWEVTGNDVYYSSGHVGIGTQYPDAELSVVGSAFFNYAATDEDFRVSSDNNTYMFFIDGGNDRVGIGTFLPESTLDVRGSATFNENGNDHDFRIESDTDPHIFFVNAGAEKIGISESSPDAKLHINSGGIGPGLLLENNTNGHLAWPSTETFRLGTWNIVSNIFNERLSILNPTTSPGSIVFNEGGEDFTFRVESQDDDNMLYINKNNQIGIRTSAPLATLDVNGSANFNRFSGDNDFNIYGVSGKVFNVDASQDAIKLFINWGFNKNTTNLNLTYNGAQVGYWSSSTGNYVATSDRSAKKDISYLNEPILDKLHHLKPAFYRLNHVASNGPRNIGFIAQEVEEYFPEIVRKRDDGKGLGLHYPDFGVLAIKAIQEQQEIINTQGEKINTLSDTIEKLLQRIEALENN